MENFLPNKKPCMKFACKPSLMPLDHSPKLAGGVQALTVAGVPAAGRSILSTTRSHRGADAYREVAKGLRERVASAS